MDRVQLLLVFSQEMSEERHDFLFFVFLLFVTVVSWHWLRHRRKDRQKDINTAVHPTPNKDLW